MVSSAISTPEINWELIDRKLRKNKDDKKITKEGNPSFPNATDIKHKHLKKKFSCNFSFSKQQKKRKNSPQKILEAKAGGRPNIQK